MTANSAQPPSTLVKSDLRRQLREVLRGLSTEQIHARSVAATQLLLTTPEFRRAESVMVFFSLPTEVDTTSVVLQCWRDGKRVLAPKVSYDIRRMIAVEISSFSDLQHDELGIRQPVQGVPAEPGQIDLILVPGLGFDSQGHRIGRGGGFYDRFLSQVGLSAVACGLAFEEQFVPMVPTVGHDCEIRMLVTDQQVRYFGDPEELPASMG